MFILNVLRSQYSCLYVKCVIWSACCDIVTDPNYFIPAFVELTSSYVEENRRLIVEHGITFPIGMFEFYGVTIQLNCNMYSR